MRKRNILTGSLAAVGILILIIDSRTALAGATEGMELVVITLIPSLFPFFILSVLLTSSLSGIQVPGSTILGKLCKIPRGAEGILLTGLLGGYPVGAQASADAWKNGQLSRSQASRMLRFCNNAGPSFLFGVIAPQFPDPGYAFALWIIHIASALAVGAILPACDCPYTEQHAEKSVPVSRLMQQSLIIMATVSGWVILFRVVLRFLERWILWLFPLPVRIAAAGFLELANGCCALGKIESVGVRFVLCACMLSFGGLCVTLQTFSVASGLDTKGYLWCKCLQTLISLGLALIYQLVFLNNREFSVRLGVGFAFSVLGFALIKAVKRKKAVAFT